MRRLPKLPQQLLDLHRATYLKPLACLFERLGEGEPIRWRRNFATDAPKLKSQKKQEQSEVSEQRRLLQKKPVRKYVKRIAELLRGKEGLLTARPERVDEIAKEFECNFLAGSDAAVIDQINKRLICRIFDYDDGFAQAKGPDVAHCWPCPKGRYGWCSNASGWGAVELLKYYHGFLRYCPYCNADTVYVMESGKKYVKSSLDHFYPQSRFPFFALSLYNLIPSCTRCNSGIKHDKSPFDIGLKSPFMLDVHDEMIFAPVVRSMSVFNGRPKEGEVGVVALPRTHTERKSNDGVKQAEFLKLPTLYASSFESEIVDSIRLRSLYASHHLKQLKKILHVSSMDELERLVFGMPSSADAIHRFRLSKLNMDIRQIFD